MKILMTADAVGDVWTHSVELTRALPDHSFVLAVMGPAPSDAQRIDLAHNVRVVGLDCRLEWMSDPWEDVERAGEWLLDLERRENPDLVHLNGYAHAALPFRAPKLVAGHSCIFSWWRAVNGEDPPRPAWNRYHDEVERGLRAAGCIVAPSRTMLAALHQHYRFSIPERVIYNGRTRQPTTGNRQPIVFCAGRLWDEAKNLRAVLEAAPRIHAPVNIAGLGGCEGPNVTYLGRLDRMGMIRALGEASIYLSPAVYEPFGLSILEAALAGCALVLGDIPSLREIWENSAIFVPPRDPAAVAAAVNALLRDDSLRDEMAARALKRSIRFNPGRMAIEYSDLYSWMAAPRTGEHRGRAAEARP